MAVGTSTAARIAAAGASPRGKGLAGARSAAAQALTLTAPAIAGSEAQGRITAALQAELDVARAELAAVGERASQLGAQLRQRDKLLARAERRLQQLTTQVQVCWGLSFGVVVVG